jgi:hypothetical protein
MSETDDEFEDLRRLRDALELGPDEIDAAARERHVARALDAFDGTIEDAPASVAPMRGRRRTRRLASVAAAAAVVLAVAAVGAVIASRDDHDTTATRTAESAAVGSPSTTAPSPLAAQSPTGDASSSDATLGDAVPTQSLGDFPTVDALRAATSSSYGTNSSALGAKPGATSGGAAPSATARSAPRACPTPPLDGGRVVGRAIASVVGAPVTAWIVDDGSGARHVIVIDDATCTVRSR